VAGQQLLQNKNPAYPVLCGQVEGLIEEREGRIGSAHPKPLAPPAAPHRAHGGTKKKAQCHTDCTCDFLSLSVTGSGEGTVKVKH